MHRIIFHNAPCSNIWWLCFRRILLKYIIFYCGKSVTPVWIFFYIIRISVRNSFHMWVVVKRRSQIVLDFLDLKTFLCFDEFSYRIRIQFSIFPCHCRVFPTLTRKLSENIIQHGTTSVSLVFIFCMCVCVCGVDVSTNFQFFTCG